MRELWLLDRINLNRLFIILVVFFRFTFYIHNQTHRRVRANLKSRQRVAEVDLFDNQISARPACDQKVVLGDSFESDQLWQHPVTARCSFNRHTIDISSSCRSFSRQITLMARLLLGGKTSRAPPRARGLGRTRRHKLGQMRALLPMYLLGFLTGTWLTFAWIDL